VFFKNAADGAVAGALHDAQFHHFVFQEPQRPARIALRRSRTGQCRQPGLLFSVENGHSCRALALLAAQHRVKAFFNELLPHPRHHGHVCVQGLDDPAIAPALATLRGIGFEQYPGFQQPFGGALSFVDESLQIIALRFAQFDHVFLYRNFPTGHRKIPLQLLRPPDWDGRNSPNLTRRRLRIPFRPLNQFAAALLKLDEAWH